MVRLPKIGRYPGRVYLIPMWGLSNTRTGFSYRGNQPCNSTILLPHPQVVFYRRINSAKGHHMSESLAVGHAAARPAPGRAATAATADAAGIAALDPRRKLQLALGVIWVLDGILQYQPSMFTKSFPD